MFMDNTNSILTNVSVIVLMLDEAIQFGSWQFGGGGQNKNGGEDGGNRQSEDGGLKSLQWCVL